MTTAFVEKCLFILLVLFGTTVIVACIVGFVSMII